jgi:hypothetical protein
MPLSLKSRPLSFVDQVVVIIKAVVVIHKVIVVEEQRPWRELLKNVLKKAVVG